MMSDRQFTHFVIFAEMRTGSNFLEANINQFSDLHCYGEIFNPKFVGDEKSDSLMGETLKDREADPDKLVAKLIGKDQAAIPGFRFFFDHDARILKSSLNDKKCAKIILTRNQLESYVSRKIAAKTGQWKLTDLKDKKSAQITFSAPEFETHLETSQKFQLELLSALQTSGQTAFYINYDDINSIEVLNGLAKFIGSGETTKSLKTSLKKQNPAPLKSKVVNFDEMKAELAKIDFLNLSRTPNFEPRRGAGVPGYYTGNKAPVLFVPIKGAPIQRVLDWMARHDGGSVEDLQSAFNQKSLRQWRRQHPNYQSLTVVRHPLERAYFSFCKFILSPVTAEYKEIRNILIQVYGLVLPEKDGERDFGIADQKAAFLDFLTFLSGNLSGQTRVRIDPAWASQTAILQGASEIAPLGNIIREQDLGATLSHLENILGLTPSEALPVVNDPAPIPLADLYDGQMEEKSRKIYQRDYLNFGFSDWSAGR